MIPIAFIRDWQNHVDWESFEYVEQDLILSRALVEIFSDDSLKNNLAFRGGTALNKLFLQKTSRYSEDIDLVHITNEPIGKTIDKLRIALDHWLGKPRREFGKQMVTLYYKFKAEESGASRKLKVEINNQESGSHFGFVDKKFSVDNMWYQGSCCIRTYSLEELLATKFRALYQRKKGRDLFDLAIVKQTLNPDYSKIAEAFRYYLNLQNLKISKKQFLLNLTNKKNDPVFCNDIWPIKNQNIEYDQAKAFSDLEKIITDFF